MRWTTGRRSGNVIDVRGRGGKMAAGGGIGMALLALVVYVIGGDPSVLTDTRAPAAPAERTAGATDPGADFAQAYVIAHEVGHHVQTLLGVSQQVDRAQRGAGRAGANALSVRQELQADCFAGLWAHHAQRARNILEPGDIEEALGAASAIGDDRQQRAQQGYVVPESFTHGTSAQRTGWFRRGFQSGTLEACDTFQG